MEFGPLVRNLDGTVVEIVYFLRDHPSFPDFAGQSLFLSWLCFSAAGRRHTGNW